MGDATTSAEWEGNDDGAVLRGFPVQRVRPADAAPVVATDLNPCRLCLWGKTAP